MWCFITEEPNYWTAEYAEYGDRLNAALARRRAALTPPSTMTGRRSMAHTHTPTPPWTPL